MTVRRVLITAKAPGPGVSKTRLVPPLQAEVAADLARAMLLDTVGACRTEADRVGLLCAGADQVAPLAALVGADVEVHVQQGAGLGAALREEMRTASAAEPLALVSSDIPGPPVGAVRRAFELLADADVVLGRCLDGGYWLIAMSAFHEAVFHDIPWSTPACAAVTCERARAAGLRVAFVADWMDIDTSIDLSYAVHAPPGPVGARTHEVLDRIGGLTDIPPPPDAIPTASVLEHASPWRSFLRDSLRGADGSARDYAYLAVPRAVFVVAVTTDGDVLLVRQYRHPVRDWTLEVPAGTVEDGETPRAAAERELAEETGGRAAGWRHLGTFFSSSAHLSLRSDAFLATGVVVGERPDDGEIAAVVRMPATEAIARARRGEFVEGQTALCLLLAAEHLP